jgi:hypothetical protein
LSHHPRLKAEITFASRHQSTGSNPTPEVSPKKIHLNNLQRTLRLIRHHQLRGNNQSNQSDNLHLRRKKSLH